MATNHIEKINHDVLFKLLLKTFFLEFLDLFLPEVAAFIDSESIVFVDKELFADILGKERSESDLVAKSRFKNSDIYFLLLCEPMSYSQSSFPARLLLYLALLFKEYGHIVYPIVIYSYDEPIRQEPSLLEFDFPNKKVLSFDYDVIQLNRLNWKDFVDSANPVASALMAKMRIDPKDRAKAKAACMRSMITLDLDIAKMKLISGFVHTYLKLNPIETREFEKAVSEFDAPIKEKTIMLMNYWEEKGMEIGMEKGSIEEAQRLTLRLLIRNFGELSEMDEGRIRRLPLESLENLFDALHDFTTSSDLENWLSLNTNNEA